MFGNHLVLKFEPQKHRRRDGIVLRTGSGIAANSQNNILFYRGGVWVRLRRLSSAAHKLIPPCRRIKCANGSDGNLYSAANIKARAHLLRAFASTFFRELVHRMTAANGSILSPPFRLFNRNARFARSVARFSFSHTITKSNTAPRY
jgi:hypothetical protein